MIIQWADKFDAGDLAWILIASAAVLILYLPGLVLFYGGLLGRTRLGEQADRWLGVAGLMAAAWCLWGYSLAFAPSWGTVPESDPTMAPLVLPDFQTMMRQEEEREDLTDVIGRGGWIGGGEYMALQGFSPAGTADSPTYSTRRPHHHLPHILFTAYQLMLFLAVPAPLLVLLSGRLSWPGLAGFAVLWGTVVYVPLAHWLWGDGWLGERGAVDAGGGLFHLAIGGSALACAWFVRTVPNGAPANSPSLPICAEKPSVAVASLGAVLFLAGSLFVHANVEMQPNGQAAVAWLNTMLAAATGLLGWAGTAWFVYRRNAPAAYAAGLVAGVAGIAAGAGLVAPQSALIIGAIAGGAGALLFEAFTHKPKVHPAVCLFAVLGLPGLVGMLLTGLFAISVSGVHHWDGRPVAGLIETGEFELLVNQALAAASAVVLSLVGTALLLAVLTRVARAAPVEQTQEDR